jgi:CheY-like chemotaxis protein
MITYRNRSILLAEDDDGHAELILEGLVDAGMKNPVIRFENGLDVLKYLEEAYSEDKTPLEHYLLLLDINMPGMDGMEVLSRIKSDSKMKSIPVIMLTTTDDPQEIALCYQQGCNFCISKPVEYLQFSEMVRHLGAFLMVIKH